ncbi:MAG: universal stress protein [Bacteroidota bacterium]
MIKGKAPYPFETIALAVGFTPRLEALIAATRRLQQLHDAKVVFIHIGKKTSDKQRALADMLNKYGFSDMNAKVIWEQGNVVDTITRICKQHVVDLLVMGALNRVSTISYYVGTISRDVARKAKCSVLLLTHPDKAKGTFQRICVGGHEHQKTPFTVNTALYIAEKELSSDVVVVTEIDVPVMEMGLSEDSTSSEIEKMRHDMRIEQQDRQSELRKKLESTSANLSFATISGRSGHSIGQYAQSEHFDLLVVNSPDHALSIFDRIFTHDIEYLLSELPCNLLIVHSRFSGNAL